MNIIMMRHGQTDANMNMVIQGITDNPLNNTGIQSCKKAALNVTNINPDLVVITPLIRTKQSFESLNSITKWNCDVITLNEFIERDFGELDMKPVSNFYEISDLSKIKDYENDETIKNRVFNGFKYLKDNYNDNDTIFIVAHAHVLKTALVLSGDNDGYSKKLHNCHILKFVLNDNLELTKKDSL